MCCLLKLLMPLKRGPHGCMRHYSATTGKYERECSIFNISTNTHLSKSEKRYLRTEKLKRELYEKALKSTDPFLFDTYDFLERTFPNKTLAINDTVYDETSKRQIEIDIICNNCFVEIKSGEKPRLEKQAIAQINVAHSYGMKHVVYAPRIRTQAKIAQESKGIVVAKNKKELFEAMK